MQLTSLKMDKAAVGLSLMCVAHCLLTPIAIVMLPALGAIFLEDERFHSVLLFLVLPTSLLALTIGCRKHRRIEDSFNRFGRTPHTVLSCDNW